MNLARLGRFGESLAGGLPDLDILSAPTWPGGYHAALGLIFRILGAEEALAFDFNALAAAVAAGLIYLAGVHLFRRESAGLWAATLWCLLPLQARYAAATDLTVWSTLWLAGSILAASLAARKHSDGAYALLLATLALAAHARFENILLAAPCAWFLRREGWSPWSRPTWKIRLLHAAWLASLAPLALLVARNRGLELPGFSDSPAGHLSNLLANIPANILFLLGEPAPAALALTAAVTVARTRERGAAWLALVALAYFLVYASFFRGRFSQGSEDRYALSVLLPCALLAGHGFSLLTGVRPLGQLLSAVAALGLFVAALLKPDGGPAEQFAAEDGCLRKYGPILPPQAYVISYSVPAVLVAAGRPAVSPYLLLEHSGPGLPAFLSGHPLFLFRDFWWDKRPRDSERLEALLRRDFEQGEVIGGTTEAGSPGVFRCSFQRLRKKSIIDQRPP